MIMIKERIGKLLSDIKAAIYPKEEPISGYRIKKTAEVFADVAHLDTQSWDRLESGQVWGGHREYYWLETVVTIPDNFAGECVVYECRTGREAFWDATNPQFTIYVNGVRKQGLDVNHREIILTESAQAGETFRIVLSAFTGDQNFELVMDSKMKTLDRKTEQYYYDLSIPYETARLLPDSDPSYLAIIQALNESLNLLDLRKVHSQEYYNSLELAQRYLKEHFYDTYCGTGQEVIYCVGHTHIDVAWLWTLAVTEDKAVRSFSTVLELMKQYPEYVFMSSQPQLYKYVKEKAPEVYEEIKQRIAEGRWEPEGGMFVEADCNLSSGESLVRQFVYGKRFFKEEFGKDNHILWLPDVFGYSAALPQIMDKCGIRYFMTTKISWNEFNKMPYDTFEWEGIDGTKILTHFSPSRDYQKPAEESGTETAHFTTYNAYVNPSQVKGGWERYSQKYLNHEALMSFGYGDGGGGPTKDMLENQRRLALGIPGCPKTRMGTAAEFFAKLDQEVRGNKYLPHWVGELYLEYHRGTYTSMARNKKFNRKSEFLFENAETFGMLDLLLNGNPYPTKAITDSWEVILRNQFHDILPGSSIKEVYDDSKREYEGIQTVGNGLVAQALARIARQVDAPEGSLVVFNPNSFVGNGTVAFALAGEFEEPYLVSQVAGDRPLPIQKMADGTYLAHVDNIPPKGYGSFQVMDGSGRAGCGTEAADMPMSELTASTETVAAPASELKPDIIAVTMPASKLNVGTEISATPAPELNVGTEISATSSPELRADKTCLENRFIRVTFHESGQISSIYDKENRREVLQKNKHGNVLMTYEDRPHNYDAWDVNNYYTEKSWEITDVTSIEAVENGPIRATVCVKRRYLDSTIEQYLSLTGDSPELVIRSEIDWHEEHIFLKALFPVDIHTDEATFEIQYGNVKRKTHANTMWDFARFEVCVHKWLDVSEDGYGVSVMNDCKYGCHVRGGEIGISLLKSATYPNLEADKEHHSFVYSIYPHTGDWRSAGTVKRAYALNNPMAGVVKENNPGKLPSKFSLVQANVSNVVVEAVKQAEDGEGMILRFYETDNRRTCGKLTFGVDVKTVTECNMLEEAEHAVECNGQEAGFAMRPYEIKTWRVIF